jgi:hypothetical protein
MNPQPKTIDITPTWAAILPAMLAVYETARFRRAVCSDARIAKYGARR